MRPGPIPKINVPAADEVAPILLIANDELIAGPPRHLLVSGSRVARAAPDSAPTANARLCDFLAARKRTAPATQPSSKGRP